MSDLLERIAADASDIFVGTPGRGFSVEAFFQFNGDAGQSKVSVLFDENYLPVDQFGSEIATAGPVALGTAADLCDGEGNLPQSDASIVIKEVTYYVTKAERAGDMILLKLSREQGGGSDDV